MNTLGERIKRAREKMGMTQKTLAELLDVKIPTVWRWEKGERNPNWPVLQSIAAHLNVTISDLLDDAEGIMLEGMDDDKAASSPPSLKPAPIGKTVALPGLDYWGGVVENARKAAALGKDIDLIAPMLQEALNVIEAARLATKQANASPAPAGAISA